MSGEENNDNANIMELMKYMFSSMSDQFNSYINDMNHNINNNMNSIRDDMNMNNDMVNARIESLQERIASRGGSRAVNRLNGSLQAEGIARIDTKSRLSSRASSRALSSRHLAVTLMATIRVVIVPTVLKTSPLCLSVPGVESSPSYVDSTLSVINISVSDQGTSTYCRVTIRYYSFGRVQPCY